MDEVDGVVGRRFGDADFFRHLADGGGGGAFVQPELFDFFRGFGGDGFDVHAAFGGGHDYDLLAAAVDDEGAVEFVGDAGAFFYEETTDGLAFRTGLVGGEGHAE